MLEHYHTHPRLGYNRRDDVVKQCGQQMPSSIFFSLPSNANSWAEFFMSQTNKSGHLEAEQVAPDAIKTMGFVQKCITYVRASACCEDIWGHREEAMISPRAVCASRGEGPMPVNLVLSCVVAEKTPIQPHFPQFTWNHSTQ